METLETPVELRSVLDATRNNRGDLPDENDLDAASQHNGGLRAVKLTLTSALSLFGSEG